MHVQRFVRANDGAAEIVGLVLVVGLTVLLATTVTVALTDFVQDGQVKMPVQAGADIDVADGDDRVSVTWVANANAEALHVHFEVNADSQYDVRLHQVGDGVALDGSGMARSGSKQWQKPSRSVSNGDRVSVTVTAERGGQRTVVADDTVVV